MKIVLKYMLMLLFLTKGHAQKKVDEVIKNLEARTETYGAIAQNIWDLAEMGYLEEQSAALLQQVLTDEGFTITTGVAGIPTAFVADFAEVYYYDRHEKRKEIIDIFDRIIKAAEGAARGTGTTMDYEMIGGTHELLPNTVLQNLMHSNLSKVGGVTYTPEEMEFANKIAQSLGYDRADLQVAKSVQPYMVNPKAYGSTDVGDVSFTVPTVGLNAATWVPGTPAHSWQAVAAGGTTIGTKGMMVAAKTLTMTAIDLLKDKELLSRARAEFTARRGADFKYIPLLGDRAPALDYRK